MYGCWLHFEACTYLFVILFSSFMGGSLHFVATEALPESLQRKIFQSKDRAQYSSRSPVRSEYWRAWNTDDFENISFRWGRVYEYPPVFH